MPMMIVIVVLFIELRLAVDPGCFMNCADDVWEESMTRNAKKRAERKAGKVKRSLIMSIQSHRAENQWNLS